MHQADAGSRLHLGPAALGAADSTLSTGVVQAAGSKQHALQKRCSHQTFDNSIALRPNPIASRMLRCTARLGHRAPFAKPPPGQSQFRSRVSKPAIASAALGAKLSRLVGGPAARLAVQARSVAAACTSLQPDGFSQGGCASLHPRRVSCFQFSCFLVCQQVVNLQKLQDAHLCSSRPR